MEQVTYTATSDFPPVAIFEMTAMTSTVVGRSYGGAKVKFVAGLSKLNAVWQRWSSESENQGSRSDLSASTLWRVAA